MEFALRLEWVSVHPLSMVSSNICISGNGYGTVSSNYPVDDDTTTWQTNCFPWFTKGPFSKQLSSSWGQLPLSNPMLWNNNWHIYRMCYYTETVHYTLKWISLHILQGIQLSMCIKHYLLGQLESSLMPLRLDPALLVKIYSTDSIITFILKCKIEHYRRPQ